MGLLRPDMPHVDADWHRLSRSERIKPMARHIAERGMGNPEIFYLLYLIKIGVYVLGGLCFAASTDGIGGWGAIAMWWHEPIVFQKVVLWSLLFEVLGVGCGFGPLTGKIAPPMGSPLYWLRTGTIRLPPWPNRIPFTRGDERTVVEVALYAALLIAVVYALLSGAPAIATWKIAVVLTILGVVGLRDKTIFLAARGEVYGTLTATFLLSGADMIVGAKCVMLAIWLGAATSKLNRHFPFVVATMMSNNPLVRPKWLKRRFFRRFPDDLMPGRLPRLLAHGGTVIEFGVPLVMFFSRGGLVTTIAAAVMVTFHLVILTAIPLGVPLEWNVFMIFGIATLFVDKAGVGPESVSRPWAIVALMAVVVGTVVIGNLFPRKVSFLPGMRYYAGNWDTSQWFFTESASQKVADHRVGLGLLQHKQLQKLSGRESVELPLYLGYTFRAMFAHGRGLLSLWDRVVPPGRAGDYTVVEGESVAGYAIGWSFGDGHLHNEQLVAALQRRCRFEPGELRIIMLDGQPIHRQEQEYRLIDAATGEFERGTFRVADTTCRQPWQHDVPITVVPQ